VSGSQSSGGGGGGGGGGSSGVCATALELLPFEQPVTTVKI